MVSRMSSFNTSYAQVPQAAEIERRRKRARDKAQLIVQQIRSLATKTARLRRKHRQLCAFVRESGRKNKENVFTLA